MFIGELSKHTELSIDTLRYYEKIGLISHVTRDQGGRRVYDENQLAWIGFVKVLKATGMPLKHMIEYAQMRQQGEQTTQGRLELLKTHISHIQSQLVQLQTSHNLVEAKIKTYERALEDGATIPISTCSAFTTSEKEKSNEQSS
jgi:DNA-binding transcriptional MerR regulator